MWILQKYVFIQLKGGVSLLYFLSFQISGIILDFQNKASLCTNSDEDDEDDIEDKESPGKSYITLSGECK